MFCNHLSKLDKQTTVIPYMSLRAMVSSKRLVYDSRTLTFNGVMKTFGNHFSQLNIHTNVMPYISLRKCKP